VQRVKRSGAVTSDDLAPSGKILHRTTERVKFHRTIIVGDELANRNKILNKIRRDQDIIKMKLMRKNRFANGGDRHKVPITDNNG